MRVSTHWSKEFFFFWPKNKNIYDVTFERYGQKTLKLVRDYERDLSRFNKATLDIGFLQKCKLFRFFPKFLDFKLSRREFHDTKACRRFKEDLLLFEIRQKTILRLKHKVSFESTLSILKTVLSPLDFSHIRSSIEAKTAKIKDRLSSKLERKFNNLKRRYGIPQVSNLSYDSVIFIYSHRALTETEKWFWQGAYVFVFHRSLLTVLALNVLLKCSTVTLLV